MEFFLLEDRGLISISGADRGKFLQGIITNDVGKIKLDSYIYALMLTPQGKLLYDFFIFEKDNSYLLDCPKLYIAEIIKKFNIYKLRSSVEITALPNHKVYASFSRLNALFLSDPRNNELGYRSIIDSTISLIGAPQNIVKYSLKRVELLIPDITFDLEIDSYFPLELQFDKLNAIDFKKGCYVGQEVTARTYYRGVIRKKIYNVEILKGKVPKPGSNIELEEKKIGRSLGFIENQGLALLNIESTEATKGLLLKADQSYIKTKQ